jgi:hypothetical protein
VLFHCSPPDEKKGSQTFRIDLLQFMIANIFQEAAGDFFDMEMTDAGENEAAIVSMASESEKVTDELLEKIAFYPAENGRGGRSECHGGPGQYSSGTFRHLLFLA